MFPVTDKERSLPALDGLEEHFFCRQNPYSNNYGHIYICSLGSNIDNFPGWAIKSGVAVSVPCSPSNKTCPGPLTEAMESGVGLLSSDRPEKVYHLKGK